jgi:hypothetical protein
MDAVGKANRRLDDLVGAQRAVIGSGRTFHARPPAPGRLPLTQMISPAEPAMSRMSLPPEDMRVMEPVFSAPVQPCREL